MAEGAQLRKRVTPSPVMSGCGQGGPSAGQVGKRCFWLRRRATIRAAHGLLPAVQGSEEFELTIAKKGQRRFLIYFFGEPAILFVDAAMIFLAKARRAIYRVRKAGAASTCLCPFIRRRAEKLLPNE
jgi:hypothetical protein